MCLNISKLFNTISKFWIHTHNLNWSYGNWVHIFQFLQNHHWIGPSGFYQICNKWPGSLSGSERRLFAIKTGLKACRLSQCSSVSWFHLARILQWSQTISEVSKHIQKYLNISKSIQTYPNLSEHIKMYQNISRWIKTF